MSFHEPKNYRAGLYTEQDNLISFKYNPNIFHDKKKLLTLFKP